MAKLCLYKLESDDDDDDDYHDHDHAGGLRLRSLKLQPPTGLLVIPGIKPPNWHICLYHANKYIMHEHSIKLGHCIEQQNDSIVTN
jgi:hypothetical protein